MRDKVIYLCTCVYVCCIVLCINVFIHVHMCLDICVCMNSVSLYVIIVYLCVVCTCFCAHLTRAKGEQWVSCAINLHLIWIYKRMVSTTIPFSTFPSSGVINVMAKYSIKTNKQKLVAESVV